MIEFNNVVKRFRLPDGNHNVILNNITMNFPKRNIAILGANGAGKTTLLKLISGAEPVDSGKIEKNVKVSFPLGFRGSFNGELTGLENTRFAARIYGQDTDKIIAYVKEFAELGSHLNAPFRTYSSGMQAKLAFGISLAIDFECYLVDEITAVGDQRFRNRSRKAFTEKLKNANIIMVSHAMDTLKDYCDMGIVVRKGRLLVFDDLRDAIKVHNDHMQQ